MPIPGKTQGASSGAPKNGLSEQEAVARAAGAGVRVYGLSEFLVSGQTPPIPATVLLGYATMPEEDLREGMRSLRMSGDEQQHVSGCADINLDNFFTMKYT